MRPLFWVLAQGKTEMLAPYSLTPRVFSGVPLKQDESSADLLTASPLPMSNHNVTPLLEMQLKKRSRVMRQEFECSARRPENTAKIDDDGEGRRHHLYSCRR